MPKTLDYASAIVSIVCYLLIAWLLVPPAPHRTMEALRLIPWLWLSVFVPYVWLGLTQYGFGRLHVRLNSIPFWVDLFFDRPRAFQIAVSLLVLAPGIIQLVECWYG